MSVVNEIKALQAKRFEHEAAIREIDSQLEDIRALLGGIPAQPNAPARKRLGRQHGTPNRDADGRTRTERLILEALAVLQPQTVKMLDSRIDVATCGLSLKPMTDEGLVKRRAWRLKGERRPSFWYALTDEALDVLGRQFTSAGQVEIAEVDDPQNPTSPSSAFLGADGIGSDAATSGTAPIIEAVSPPFERLNGSLGSEK